ncbi:MAG TPA: DUF6049 family protein [Propionicimonas sp.]|nr:DUF6049 family protein [Propionicimonas sp.]
MIGTSNSRRRAFALLLAWGAAVVGLGALNPVVARAATPQVTVTMTSISVSGTKPDDQVTLQGTVTNTGDIPAFGVQVLLWGSRDPIRDLATLRQAGLNATGWGVRLPINSDHYAVITTSAVAFAPGASHQVELRATLAELGVDTRGAAYAFGADVIASTDNVGTYVTAGQLRTFIAVPGKRTVPVTSIVLLAANPTKLVDDLFRNDDLTAELSGRLENLLTAAARPGMSWLIDPALLDEVRDMSDGYQVQDGAKTVPGAGQQVAAAWLARFDKLDRHAGGRTMFASPDINPARLDDDQELVQRAALATEEVSRVADLPLIVVPAGHILPIATYDYLADSGAEAIIATNTAAAGALQSGTAEPRVLATSAEVPGPAETPGVERRPLALAAAAIAGGKGQLRLLTSLSDVAEDEATSTSWMRRRDLGELLATEPRVKGALLTAAEAPGLGERQFDMVDRLTDEFDAYGDLVPDSALIGQADAATPRSTASAWIRDTTGFDDYSDGLSRLVGGSTVGRAVVLDASPRFLMSSRTNQFPVTVTNNLTERIRVQVVVRTDNPQRLTVPPSEVVTVDPGQSMTVNIRPEATANGLVIARAHVATADGHRVTPDTSITVEITDLGLVAWIIVTVSGLVLVAATVFRIRQVRRRTATTGTPGLQHD